MEKILKYVLVVVVACVLSSAMTIGYFECKNMDGKIMGNENGITGIKGSNMNLSCELPTEQPVLPILKLKLENISNEAEAKSFATKYFPEFERANFMETSDSNKFVLKLGEATEYLEIYKSGCLIYMRSQDKDIKMNQTEFPQEMALNISHDFILSHGELEDFKLESIAPYAQLNEDGEPTGIIKGYYLVYRHSYNDIPISGPGGDGIKADVKCGGNVTYFFRLMRTPTEETSTVKVVSASQAFNSLKKSYKGKETTITNVSLCYYSENFKTVQESMEPAWRFEIGGKGGVGSGSYLYVNAVNGTPL